VSDANCLSSRGLHTGPNKRLQGFQLSAISTVARDAAPNLHVGMSAAKICIAAEKFPRLAG